MLCPVCKTQTLQMAERHGIEIDYCPGCRGVWLDQPQRRTLWVGVWEENFGAQRFYARYGCRKVGEYDFIVGDTHDREFILRRA